MVYSYMYIKKIILHLGEMVMTTILLFSVLIIILTLRIIGLSKSRSIEFNIFY